MRYIVPFLSIAVSVVYLRWAWKSAQRPPEEIRLVKDVNPFTDDEEWIPEDPVDALQQM